MEKDTELGLDMGIEYAKAGKYDKAMDVFESSDGLELFPLAMSSYALCLAELRRDFDRACDMCLIALKRDFRNPQIYMNLGKIYLTERYKRHAIKAFERGLKIESSNKELARALSSLGVRRRPVFSFLSRGNVINRMLGKSFKGGNGSKDVVARIRQNRETDRERA